LKTWQTYAGPTKGFDEMVFNIQPLADDNHQTLAAVVNKAGDKGHPFSLIPASYRC
jgi:hypothetical protein